jgi:hypothetical protein
VSQSRVSRDNQSADSGRDFAATQAGAWTVTTCGQRIGRRRPAVGVDVDDVGQSVWLQLVNQLDRVRDLATALIDTGADSARSEIDGQAMVK